MTWIGNTAALAGLILLAAGCRPTEPEPLDSAPTYEPTVEADAPEASHQPARPETAETPPQPPETLPDAAYEADRAGESEAESDQPGDESPGGGVLGAVGRAMFRSVAGDTEEAGDEKSPPSDQ